MRLQRFKYHLLKRKEYYGFALIIFPLMGVMYHQQVNSLYGSKEIFNIIRENNVKQLDHYLAAGKSLEVKGNKNYTPLLAAANEGHFDLFLTLEKSGAKYSGELVEDKLDPYHNGMSLFFLAVKSQNVKLIEYLLQQGHDPNEKNKQMGYPVINVAIRNCDVKSVELLIKYKADVNSLNRHGRSPAHVAVRRNCATALETLKKAGANLQVKDAEQKTPLMIAEELKRNPRFINLLKY